MNRVDVREAITQAHHEEWARVVAALARRFGDLDIAEEAAAANASAAVAPAPGTSGFASRHARRSSSDRKKLSVVQCPVIARRWSSQRRPTHTMTPSAEAPGPSGVTVKASGLPEWWH